MPNWYGIEGISFEWRGAWNEPLLHYKGQVFYSSDIEDALYENYVEDGGNLDNHDEWIDLDELRFLHGYAHMFIWDADNKVCDVINLAE